MYVSRQIQKGELHHVRSYHSRINRKKGFKNLTPELDSEKIVVSHPDVNRPALQLTGFYAHFDNERVQMIGNVETAISPDFPESAGLRCMTS